jgi:hypothetical protein
MKTSAVERRQMCNVRKIDYFMLFDREKRVYRLFYCMFLLQNSSGTQILERKGIS